MYQIPSEIGSKGSIDGDLVHLRDVLGYDMNDVQRALDGNYDSNLGLKANNEKTIEKYFPDMYRIWKNYSDSMRRRRPGDELGIYSFTKVALGRRYAFVYGDSAILGRFSSGYFTPSHFCPNSMREGVEMLKELAKYDNILFAVTDDLGPMLVKIGLYGNDKSTIPMFFRNRMVEKQIYTTDRELLERILNGMPRDELMKFISDNHYSDMRDKVRMRNRYGDIEIGSNSEKERVQMRNPVGRNRKWAMESIIRKVVNEELNRRVALNEKSLYHASGGEFDKFNHKKYLSSGAGSQTFGWGTYLTDSYEIARSYAYVFMRKKFSEYILLNEPTVLKKHKPCPEDIYWAAYAIYFGDIQSVVSDNFTKILDKDYFDDKLREVIRNFDPTNYSDGIKYIYKNMRDIEKLRERWTTEEWQTEVFNLVKAMINEVWTAAYAEMEKGSYIYEVEIPDDDGSNYIDFNNKVSQDVIKRVTSGLRKIGDRFGVTDDMMSKWEIFFKNKEEEVSMYRELHNDFMNASKTGTKQGFSPEGFRPENIQFSGKALMDVLSGLFKEGISTRSDKAVALFLNQCGFVGIKYIAGTRWGLPNGAQQGSMNYVIFDSNNVKITSKNLFKGR